MPLHAACLRAAHVVNERYFDAAFRDVPFRFFDVEVRENRATRERRIERRGADALLMLRRCAMFDHAERHGDATR